MFNQFYENITRYIEKIDRIVKQGKILLLLGQRNSGKRKIIEEFASKLMNSEGVDPGRVFGFDLDDILERLDLEENIFFFKEKIEQRLGKSLADVKKPVVIVFLQIQNLPKIFSAIARLKESNPANIVILMTSSINLTDNKAFAKNLQPLTGTIRVFSGGINEIIDARVTPLNGNSVLETIFCESLSVEKFQKLAAIIAGHEEKIKQFQRDYLLFGVLPKIFETDVPNKRWQIIEDHLRLFFERDLLRVFQITDLQKFRQILTVLSFNNGNILNLLNMCDDFGINRNTMRKYAGIMRDTFLVDFVPSYNKEIKKPTMKTPKLYFLNPGLVNFLNRVRDYRSMEQSKNFERLLDSMLYLNLQITMQRCEQPPTLFFLKDYQDHELDFIIDTGKGLIPIGITYDNAERKNKIKTFKYYVRYCSQISNGVIFGDFDEIESLEMRGAKLYLLPIWMLF